MRVPERAPARPALGRLDLALAALLVLLVLGLYAPTAGHDFVSYDDGSYVTENPHVAGGLTGADVRWAWSEFHSSNWHPLTWLSHQLDVELFGLAPGPMHLVNVGLHALNALLCFLFFRRATGVRWASLLVALVFALHPLRVQSVAWIAERKDVLAGGFFFLALLAHERFARAPTRGRQALVALAMGLGLLAKPMLVTLPLVLLLVDAWPLGRLTGSTAKRLVLEKLPLFALAAASGLVTLVAQRAGGAVQSLEVLDLPERVATALQGTCLYLAKSLVPSGLAFFYPHPALVGPSFAPAGVATGLALALLVALSVLAWRLRARAPECLVGWLWMLVMLLPVCGLVQVGAQLWADRYAYLPLVGPTFAVVFGLRRALPEAGQRLGFGLGLAVVASWAVISWTQIATWRDSRTLCERALAVTERNYVAHEHLGLFLQRQGELAGAQRNYEAAVAITPLASSLSNLGTIHAHLGRAAEATAAFEQALRLQPEFLNGRLSYGLFLEGAGELARAAEQFEAATRAHPESADAWRKLGDVRRAEARPAEARAAYERARALAGATPALELGLAACALALGERDAALAHLAARARALAAPASGEPNGWQALRARAAQQAAAGDFAAAARTAAEAWAGGPAEEGAALRAEHELYKALQP
jgi:protein O-mannosyl-transferase